MVLIFLFLLLLLFPLSIIVSSAPLITHSIPPNFTATNYHYIDELGDFLISQSHSFKASLTNTIHDTSSYYFFLIHVHSNTIIWSANPNHPVTTSSQLTLTDSGLFIADDSHNIIWSTPHLNSQVSAMILLDTGNLILVDKANVSLWESFEFPTDTIVSGQRLGLEKSLVAAAYDNDDLSGGDYRVLVTEEDLLLKWNQLTFWKLSMDTGANRVKNVQVSFMAINGTGLYLFGGTDGSTVVMQVVLDPSEFRFGRIGSDGRFKISSFMNRNVVQEFVGPKDDCQIPTICGKLQMCSAGICSCPPNLIADSQNTKGGCVPADKSLSLPSACTSNNRVELNSSLVNYLRLSTGIDYFANNFMDPAKRGVSLSFCKDLCSSNCSCLGLFYENSSSSCFLVQNKLGSIIMTSSSGSGYMYKGRVGYIKTIKTSVLENPSENNGKHLNIPLAGLILIPSSALFLLIACVAVAVFCFRRCKLSRNKMRMDSSSSSAELDMILITGLPVRYDYDELVTATEDFKTQIGSGGFGTVYKGTLPDKTIVAVKKITSFGAQGKKEFFTEIAIIGNIHHINLVRLKGFCIQRKQRFLVLEYMNRGSLDHALFGHFPVLEWRDRFQIALGTARGLAYLHSGCDHKIIHCDVKPENILLSDNSHVKISDFGLSKLLSPEESGWFTTLRGTRGYLAPEWLTSSAISDKTDVYSYGMVLLEIVRGRKNCSFPNSSHGTEQNSSNQGDGDGTSSSSGNNFGPVYFPLLALEMHQKGRYLELADPRLEGRVRSEEVEKLIRVGLCCLHEDPTLRPSMSNVVGMLEGGVALGEPRIESLNFLRFYGRRFTESSSAGNLTDQSQSQVRRLSPENGGNNNVTDPYGYLSYISSQQVSGPR